MRKHSLYYKKKLKAFTKKCVQIKVNLKENCMRKHSLYYKKNLKSFYKIM